MISPTGLGIRHDSKGSGDYGALRSQGRRHRGLDFLCIPGQDVVAPFKMTIDRVSFPYSKGEFQGIAWHSSHLTGKLFYMEPLLSSMGLIVGTGDTIGVAQDISKKYGSEMRPHVHFQIDSFDPQCLLDLTELFKKLLVWE